LPSSTAPAVVENAGYVSGGGITTHHNGGVAMLIKVSVERRPPGRKPTPLLFEQANSMVQLPAPDAVAGPSSRAGWDRRD
jgi:hypothetical protein